MNKAFQKTLIATALVCVGALAQAQSPRGPQDATGMGMPGPHFGPMHRPCLLYTSDAADE